MSDKVIFAWIKPEQMWQEPHLVPQILHDEHQTQYLVKEKHLDIRWKVELTGDDLKLSLDELILKYPSPGLPQ